MFVIELTYKADLGAIDAHMAAHMKFLKKYYTSGHFLMSGRKVPRDGGIILADGESRTEIEAIAREDPFYVHGLADIRVDARNLVAARRRDSLPRGAPGRVRHWACTRGQSGQVRQKSRAL